MGWFIQANIFSTILSLIQVGRLSDKDKDLEVTILRHQLAVMTRYCQFNLNHSQQSKDLTKIYVF